MLQNLVVVISTAITAVATSLSAYVTWRIWRGQVSVDWEFMWSDSGQNRHLEVRATVLNRTRGSYVGQKVKILDCPVVDVQVGNPPREKHESWPKEEAPLDYGDIEPGKSRTYRALVFPNWSELFTKPSKRLITRSITDAPLLVQLTVASKSSRRRKKSFSDKIRIPRKMIETIASSGST